MATYVVMETKAMPGEATAGTAFVRDGFHWLAFLLPVFWLLWHRLWIEAVLAFAAVAALSAVVEIAGIAALGPLVVLPVSVYFGLEGAALRVAALRRRGWREWGVVHAGSVDEAEARYEYERVEHDGPEDRLASPPPPASVPLVRPAVGPTIGLVSYPGKL
ncbi:DUF2628 domain-containing protein [Arvimicrobium flavum]|uniref:DUF2628 domain-containing protein n=1 Tax=Arvimicrobium flavum TaxID=3393320 RepID=UPI00237A9520|nr:DUF2628 domain-containing protein [Mesorhizobium shangrilense]